MSTPLVAQEPVAAAAPHPLRHAPYRRWLIGNSISLLGDQCYLVALPWLILQQTGSAAALGTVMMLAAVPRALLMLLGGALSDRMSARKVMLAAAIVRAACVAALGLLAWRGELHMWELYSTVLIFGIADAFALPAQSAYLPTLLPREQLVAASSINQVATGVVTIGGPAPAGLLVGALGVASAFLADALSFLAVIAALWRLPDPARAPAPTAGVHRAIAEGIAYVMRDVPLRSLMFLAMALNLCLSGPLAVGLAYLTKIQFDSPTAYGSAVAALAAGSLLGALLAGVWKTPRRGRLILNASVVLSLCLMAIGQVHGLWQVATVLCAMGVAAGLVNVHVGAWMMQRIDATVRGRVSSVLMLGSLGVAPISLAFAGYAAAWNVAGMFLAAGVLMLMAAAAAATHRQVREIC